MRTGTDSARRLARPEEHNVEKLQPLLLPYLTDDLCESRFGDLVPELKPADPGNFELDSRALAVPVVARWRWLSRNITEYGMKLVMDSVHALSRSTQPDPDRRSVDPINGLVPRAVHSLEVLPDVCRVGSTLDDLVKVLGLAGESRDRVVHSIPLALRPESPCKLLKLPGLLLQNMGMPGHQLAERFIVAPILDPQVVVELLIRILDACARTADPRRAATGQSVEELM